MRKKKFYHGGIGFDDERELRRIVAEHNVKRVLEFGPGVSTRIFLNAGVEHITSCEHDSKWLAIADHRYAGNDKVRVLRYQNTPEVSVSELDGQQFDLAFVDSPQGYAGARVEHVGQEGRSRLNTLRCALRHASIVVLHDALRPGEQNSLGTLIDQGVHVVTLATKKGLAICSRS